MAKRSPGVGVIDSSAEAARRVQALPTFERLGPPLLEAPESLMEVPFEIRQNVLVTSVDKVVNWGRKSSLWPVAFGLACCAIEMMAAGTAKFDLSRLDRKSVV